ncbi:MAG: 4-hydroxythreonine-4-phosphate dehydrogenase PdxA [Planctomycetota bacterium]|nr:MAG: 4-hydroxythreonine-4-phosphate dehydrogenase PdxA [Planctomycetota bacterium]
MASKPPTSVQESRPVVAVSMGDPLGIGPEVLVKALADRKLRAQGRYVIHGLAQPLLDAAERAGIEPFWWQVDAHSGAAAELCCAQSPLLIDYSRELGLESPPRSEGPAAWAGMASRRFVAEAIMDCKRSVDDPRRAEAIVTGPVSKTAWAKAGRSRHLGHTELLQAAFGASRVVMCFDSPVLRVALATHHIPLMALRDALTIGTVFDPIDLGARHCAQRGVDSPRIGVCGLNPHAGEGGLMGEEESRLIEPAVRLAREAGIDADGPFPADALFRQAAEGRFHLVVAMYHDQGLIPLRLLARDKAAQCTLGLPVPRTSPAHGVAFDIAGGNEANPESTRRALALAVELASRPRAAAAQAGEETPA